MESIFNCHLSQKYKITDKILKEAINNLRNTEFSALGIQRIVEIENRCPICLDFWCNVETKCRHTFCLFCIKQSYENDFRCPLCRTVLN